MPTRSLLAKWRRWTLSMAGSLVLATLVPLAPALASPAFAARPPDGNSKVQNFRSSTIRDPLGITAGPDGALCFTNSGNNSIGRITTVGVVAQYTNTSIDDPMEIASGPDGALWFTNYGNNSIGRITTSGVVTNYTNSSIDQPEGITAGPDGALWFTNYGNNSIGRITTAGVVTNYTSSSIAEPVGIASGSNGALWFTNFNPSASSIGEITTAGVISSFSDPDGNVYEPDQITSGPDGALWLTNVASDSIEEVTTSGVFQNFALPNDISPSAIASGPDGALWFTAAGNVWQMTITGDVSDYSGIGMDNPQGITTGPDGAIWFTNYGNHSIGRIKTPFASAGEGGGPPGKSLGISGGGFAAGETVEVTYATDLRAPDPAVITLCSAIATTDGTFSCSGNLPGVKQAGPVGPHEIDVEGLTSLDHTHLSFFLSHVVAGEYLLYLNCGRQCSRGWQVVGDLTLYSNGDATSGFESSHGYWENTGRSFSAYLFDMIFMGQFTGVLTESGINTRAHPGSLSADELGGEWYATRG